jgi:hypothetical protein
LIVINIIPIANFIVIGYASRALGEGDELDKPPKIDRIGAAFVDGLKIIVVIILYALIPMLIIAAALIPAGITNIMQVGGIWDILMSGVAILGITIGIIVGFFIFIIGAMGIIHMVVTDSFGKAFAFGEILDIIGRIGWKRYLIWLLVMFLLSLLVGSLSSIHVLVSAIVGVFFLVFIFRSAYYIYPREEEKEAEEAEKVIEI